MFTDASLLGYGYRLQDTEQQDGGRWSEVEQKSHVNVLEIRAIHLAILSLFLDQTDLHLKVFSDSQVAINCISKEGSTKSLTCNTATRNLLLYCEKQNIELSMAHVPGVENVTADRRSRVFKNPNTEGSLDEQVFAKICHIFQVTPQIDMFAERLNT